MLIVEGLGGGGVGTGGVGTGGVGTGGVGTGGVGEGGTGLGAGGVGAGGVGGGTGVGGVGVGTGLGAGTGLVGCTPINPVPSELPFLGSLIAEEQLANNMVLIKSNNQRWTTLYLQKPQGNR